ncbi:hypothetical protein [Streptomyces bikiniensis]|uniref:hypothetical protein n=1 Tax=Streptomyces bikiniensis TaxID=1896 RepID=UPI00131A49F2|nr:hypothetical protein [Streptomyces bikiniensis]
MASLLVGTQPAFASANWQEVKTNSNWHCGDTESVGAERGFKAQTCIVANSSGYAQQVVVVSNFSGYAVWLDASITELNKKLPAHNCNGTTFQSGFQRACLGQSVYVGCNGTNLYSWSNVEISGYTKQTAEAVHRHYC